MPRWKWLALTRRAPLVIIQSVTSAEIVTGATRIVALTWILFFLGVSLLALVAGLWTSGVEALVVLPIVGLFLALLVIAVGAFAMADERDGKRPRARR